MYGALVLPLIEERDSFSIRITNTVRMGGRPAAAPAENVPMTSKAATRRYANITIRLELNICRTEKGKKKCWGR